MNRLIFSEAGQVLKPPGFLILEIGFKKVADIHRLADSFGWYSLEIRKDLAGIERCVVFSKSRPAPSF